MGLIQNLKGSLDLKRLLIILCAALMLCGCTEITAIEEEAVQADVTVTTEQPAYPVNAGGLVFNESPVTVGSLSPAVTEMIYELGYGDRLLFCSTYCDHPEQAKSLEKAGAAANPDFEKIIGLKPALVITQSPIANKDVSRLTDAGIAVMQLSAPSSLEELYSMYETLALVFAGSIDGKSLAETAVSEMKQEAENCKDSCESLVFILEVTEDGYMAATGDTFAGDYISCFGKNAVSDKTGMLMTADDLKAADPQVIFLAAPLGAGDIDSETASGLSAFSHGHVYVVDGSLMERPTSRLAGITRSISKKIREDIADTQ